MRTYSYISLGEDPPECVPYRYPLTNKHVLTEYHDNSDIRNRVYCETDMKTLFQDVVYLRNKT